MAYISKYTGEEMEQLLDSSKNKVNKDELSTVATSGSYNDLSNTPTIPSAVTESTVSGWGFTKTSGTITGININGTSVSTSGTANIPAATTNAYGVTKLSSATDSTSTSMAATSSAVKAAYDLANSYKGTVTGVKINGITNSPSSGVVDLGTVITSHQDISGKQDAITDLETIRQGAAKGATALQSYTEQYKGTVTGVTINGKTKNPSSGVVDLGYINKQLSTSTSSSMTLSPNIYYRNTSTSLSSLTITLGGVSNSNIINEYFIEFTTRSAGTTVSLPSTVKWANGETPTFENGKTYQISIVNNLGVCIKFG